MRRAVVVLLLIAVVSGLVFNAFTLLLPKLIQERLAGGDPRLLPLVGLAAFLATLCGALTQFTVGRMIDRMTLKRVFVPVSVLLVPGLVAVSYAQGWLVVPMAALVSAAIFGQVTVNETMTARYISPALRTRMYSVRFFVGFLGAAAAAPVVAWLDERTGSLTIVTLVMAGFGVVTLACALAFPDRREELRPELWGRLGWWLLSRPAALVTGSRRGWPGHAPAMTSNITSRAALVLVLRLRSDQSAAGLLFQGVRDPAYDTRYGERAGEGIAR